MANTQEAPRTTFSDAENELCISVNATTVALDYVGDIIGVSMLSGKMTSRDYDAVMFLLHTANNAALAARATFYEAFENDPEAAFGLAEVA